MCSHIYSASADKSLGVWDAGTGQRIKRLRGHTSVVNSCSPAGPGTHLLCSGSDDHSVRVWDTRLKYPVETFSTSFPVTAVCFSAAGDQVFSGSVDNQIKVWDVRKHEVIYTLDGHADTICGLKLSQDGSFLLTN